MMYEFTQLKTNGLRVPTDECPRELLDDIKSYFEQMTFECCSCYTHIVGTSGQDQAARRKFEYDTHCAQCKADVTSPGNHVAAHVMRNSCLNCCCCRGRMVLITTCKKCNNAQHPNGASFVVWCRSPNEVKLDREDAGQCLPPNKPFQVART